MKGGQSTPAATHTAGRDSRKRRGSARACCCAEHARSILTSVVVASSSAKRPRTIEEMYPLPPGRAIMARLKKGDRAPDGSIIISDPYSYIRVRKHAWAQQGGSGCDSHAAVSPTRAEPDRRAEGAPRLLREPHVGRGARAEHWHVR